MLSEGRFCLDFTKETLEVSMKRVGLFALCAVFLAPFVTSCGDDSSGGSSSKKKEAAQAEIQQNPNA